MRDMVLIVNFDRENSRSVARKLRAERVYCKIVPANIALEEVKSQEPLGLILAGASSGMMDLPGFDKELLDLGLPVLALGDAAAALCRMLGGQLSDTFLEQCVAPVTYRQGLPLFEEVSEGERMMACVRFLTLPEELEPAAWTGASVIGFAHRERPVFGLQFLVEQNDPDGIQILANFAIKICGCTPWWGNEAFIQRAVEEIRRMVGDGTALCAISGGVDSGVCAMLGHKAIGARLTCIFVDTGLLRRGEAEFVMNTYRDTLGLNVVRVDAADRFLRELSGIWDPARKHQVVSRLLQEILSAEISKLFGVNALLLGTNYTDFLSSPGTLTPMAMTVRPRGAALVEPVRELFKDEIRRVGEDLSLPPEIYNRQSFPGSGLSLRIIGDVTTQKLQILREADFIFQEEVAQSGQGKRLWQHFAVLTDLTSSGVGGMAICLRAVHASEGPAAMAARLPYDLLERVVSRILKALPQVTRVVYDLTPSHNYTGIEWL